jgi:hypothetical protein
MNLSIEKQLGLAALNGDLVAAYALKDWLEERQRTIEEQAAEQLCQHTAYDGYMVYRWGEFQALIRRLGVRWCARTVSITITIAEGEAVRIDHKYLGDDYGPQEVPADA